MARVHMSHRCTGRWPAQNRLMAAGGRKLMGWVSGVAVSSSRHILMVLSASSSGVSQHALGGVAQRRWTPERSRALQPHDEPVCTTDCSYAPASQVTSREPVMSNDMA